MDWVRCAPDDAGLGSGDNQAEEAAEFYVSVFEDGRVPDMGRDGSEGQCGWLKDRYGVSWQVIPSVLGQLISGPDLVGSQRAMQAMQAMLTMHKLDFAALHQAYVGR